MPEVTIASHKWRKKTRDWSPVCDNSLKLNRTAGMVGNPSRLNQFGVCQPACDICVTPYPSQSVDVTNCTCKTLPRFIDMRWQGGFSGVAPQSGCVSYFNKQWRLRNFVLNGLPTCSYQATDKIIDLYTAVRVPLNVGSCSLFDNIPIYNTRDQIIGYQPLGNGIESTINVTYDRLRNLTVSITIGARAATVPNDYRSLRARVHYSMRIPVGQDCFQEFTVPFSAKDPVQPNTGAGFQDRVFFWLQEITVPTAVIIKPADF